MTARPAPPPAAFTVQEFCVAHRISRGFFYTILRDGRGPRVLRVGRRTLVTADAAADWRVRMEATSGVMRVPRLERKQAARRSSRKVA